MYFENDFLDRLAGAVGIETGYMRLVGQINGKTAGDQRQLQIIAFF